MSLILEALRKSEAERRRGHAPDLFTELPPAVRQRDARLSPAVWVGLAVAVLAAAVWLTYEQWPAPARDDSTAASTRGDDPEAQTRPAQQAPTQAAMAMQTDEADAIARSRRGGAAGIAVSPTPSPDANVGAPTPAPSTSPFEQAVSENAGTAAQQRTDSASANTPVRDRPSPLPRDVVAVPVLPPASAPPLPTPAPPTTSPQGTLDLDDLSVDQRKQLPPLRMSMHMWDADPARRFVIIDGARRGEGDRIGDAVVERINADSVLLAWNGLRLRMPLR